MSRLTPEPQHPDLGEVVCEYHLGQRRSWLALQAIVIFPGMLAVVLGLIAALIGKHDSGLRPATGIAIVAAGMAVIVVGAVVLPRAARRRGGGMNIVVRQRGFVREHGHDWEVVRWDQILGLRIQLERVEVELTRRVIYPWTARVVTPLGEFDFPETGGGRRIAEVVDQARPHVWKRMIEAFDQGRPFTFGVVSASTHGLQIGNERLAWKNVQLVEEDGHKLRIHTDFGGTVVDRVGVSFLSVLRELAEQVWSRQGNVSAIPRELPPAELPVRRKARLPEARLRA